MWGDSQCVSLRSGVGRRMIDIEATDGGDKLTIGYGPGPGGRVKIREWLVENFKAISHVSTTLPPLTVLAGANSSGKSSLLQSLLFLAQSDDEDIVLNGPLARLGDPRDVIRDGADHIALGAVVEARIDDSSESSSLAFRIELKDSAGELVVKSLAVYLDDEPIIDATARGISPSQVAEINPARANLTLLRVTELYGKRAPAKTYIGFGGLSPEVFIYRQKLQENTRALRRGLRSKSRVERSRAAELLLMEMRRRLSAKNVNFPFDVLEMPTGPAVHTILGWDDGTLDLVLADLSELLPGSEWVPVQVARFAYTHSQGMRGVYQSDSLGSQKYNQALRSLSVVSDALRTLRTSVRYLGPLRAEPRVVSPTGGNYRSLPVGARGEFTADLLAHDKDRRIRFNDWDGVSRSEALPVAISLWAHYLGIGDSVAVMDQGKLGRGLRVIVNGVERDLTTIGVGASQVLPVLALVLGAPRGALLLLEQPELHLHPAVQARLADFFLFARPDLHVVVETHSEYLVTRLRLRAAESRIRPGKVDVLFASQVAGATSMRSLTLDEFGDFGDWPEGFFDTQDRDSRELVAAIGLKLGHR